MSPEWPSVQISEVCELIIDCVNKTAPVVDGPTPFKMIRTTNVRDGWVDTINVRNVDEETYNKWTRRGEPRNGDVILTREAPLGEVGLLRDARGIFLGQRLVMYRANPTKLDNRFLLYSLLSHDLQAQIKAFGSGSTVEHMRVPDCEKLILQLPPLETQQKIGSILSTYDDLIENNTRRIKILEEMARMIYREWFVNFRFPGHEQVKMVDSPLGMIPEGWEVREMQEVAEVIDCLHSKKPEEDENGKGVMLQLFNILDGGKLDTSKFYMISPDDYAKWTSRIEVQEGDCVITNVGRIAAVAQIPKGLKAAIGRNMTAVRCKPAFITPTYLIEYLLSPHMEREVHLKKDGGAIMDSLNVRGINKLNIPVPTSDFLELFEKTAQPIRRRIEVVMNQNINLRQTRDLLLPKLISGEVEV